MMQTSRTLAACALLAATLYGGCQPSSPQPAHVHSPSDAGEPGIAQQVEDVRAGRTIQIRLDHTTVHDADLQPLAGLKSTPLRINFSHSDVTDQGLARLCELDGLEQLRLSSPRITDAGLEPLAALKHLRFLHLIDMPITDAGLDHLHALNGLESLYLDGTQVTDEGLARLIKALPGVHLHIDDHHHPLDPHAADHVH